MLCSMITSTNTVLSQVGLQRYFDEVNEMKPKPVRMVCKHCGAEGDHKTSQCTVQIVSMSAFISSVLLMIQTNFCIPCAVLSVLDVWCT